MYDTPNGMWQLVLKGNTREETKPKNIYVPCHERQYNKALFPPSSVAVLAVTGEASQKDAVHGDAEGTRRGRREL